MTKESDDNPKARILVGIVIFIVILGWSAFAVFWAVDLFRHWNEPFNPGKAGQFGDTFGAVNALFSGLALVGVAYAVVLQRRELDATKKGERKNDEARAKTDLLMERQAQALLAAAKLNAAHAIWESTPSEDLTIQLVGDKPQRIQTRRIHKQRIEIFLHEICTSSPSNPNHACSPHLSYLLKLVTETRNKLDATTVSDMHSFRMTLSILVSQLALLACQDGIHGTNDRKLINSAHLMLNSLLDGSGTGPLDSQQLMHFLTSTTQILTEIEAEVMDKP